MVLPESVTCLALPAYSMLTHFAVFALIISLGQTTAHVLTGLYGQPSEIGVGVCSCSLFSWWPLLGSLSFSTSCCKRIMVSALGFRCSASPLFGRHFSLPPSTPVVDPSSKALLSHFYLLFTWNGKGRTLRDAFWRDRLPNIMNPLATVTLFAAVIYLQGLCVEISTKSCRFRRQRGAYSMELFYMSNVFIVSQMLPNRFPHNFFANLLGLWVVCFNGYRLYSLK